MDSHSLSATETTMGNMLPLSTATHTLASRAGKVTKVLCANRGEIAIRVFRAGLELGLRTVAIFSHEDRLGMHRYKADEAHEVGGHGLSPVGAYLDIPGIIEVAKEADVDAIHPGYGFLSENASFARAVEAAGMIWVGPPPSVIEMMGEKTAAKKVAYECNVPVVPGTGICSSVKDVEEFVAQHGLPVMIKAVMGGGGRGMRVVRKASDIYELYERCVSEAKASFGDGSVFVELFVETPRHIEIQIIADNEGNMVHLFERDCSVQRRNQKVVEVAPAQKLNESLRQKILAAALRLGRHIQYRNAGTVEFLVDKNQSNFYFMEVNPRIQVEHTITEMITGLDLVAAQLQIAGGASLIDLGMTQDKISVRGVAIQCRVTTEDPVNNFMPDTGRISVYRSAGGHGIRLDGGAGFVGSIITPAYDSLLVKVCAHAINFELAVFKMIRAVSEFRIRGVKTNLRFLQNLLLHPTFQGGNFNTSFIESTPELFQFQRPKNRGMRLLKYFGEVAVNGVSIAGMTGPPGTVEPIVPVSLLSAICPSYSVSAQKLGTPTHGWRHTLLERGPEAFAQAIRKSNRLLITDTTWRDAHQSLLMTRLRTADITKIAATTAHALPGLFSCEMWGGATFDVSLRFLNECPWERLRELRSLVPNIPFQMLLRGSNAVGYSSYPDNVVFEFVRLAKENGIDIFRIFDSLNYIENLKLGIDAVTRAGGVVEAAICYTGDVSDKRTDNKYNLDYYLHLADELITYGVHILAIKDMAGLLKPKAATLLIGVLRERYPDVPIHLHTHDTAGTGVATYLAAADAGVDIVDCAMDSMSGMTSQPSIGAVVNAVKGDSDLDTQMNTDYLSGLDLYWTMVRDLYQCFDSNMKSGSSDVYTHQMPGGQYTNLLFQTRANGMLAQWDNVKRAYATANQLCGDIVKVTPSSKVVGDLAQFMVANNLVTEADVTKQADKLSFPSSVVSYFQGYLGQPVGGIPEKLRNKVIKDLPCVSGRPGKSMPPLDLVSLKNTLEKKYGSWISDCDVISSALYPKVFDEYAAFRENYGQVSKVPTPMFLSPLPVGKEFSVDFVKGKRAYLKLMAISPVVSVDGTRDVYFELNGNPLQIAIEDRCATAEHEVRRKADHEHPGQVGSPMSGVVIECRIDVGHRVKEGDPCIVVCAMKLETVVIAPTSGTVHEICVEIGDSLSAGDLLLVIIPESSGITTPLTHQSSSITK